jgi:drug/metabolite transporter (DMT)-like permease
VIFLIALVTGTASSILSKVLMDMSGTGMDGKTHTFARPLAQTLGMFLGMIAGLPMHAIVVWWKIPFPGYRHDKSSRMLGSDEENMPLVPTGNLMDNPNTVPYWMHLYLAIPALFDLLATALSMVGLRYLDVSVYQLLRGSGIIFVAVMKQSVLKDRLYRFQWVGVSWNVVAVLLVGVAALLDSTQDEKIKTSTTIIGILVMLLATFIQSLQFVFEEKVMTADENKAPPLLLFGMEGLWGTFLCCAILYPIAYWIPGDDNGSFEDPFNTWALLMNTRLLQIMFTFYVLAILAYNLFSILGKFIECGGSSVVDAVRRKTQIKRPLSPCYSNLGHE